MPGWFCVLQISGHFCRPEWHLSSPHSPSTFQIGSWHLFDNPSTASKVFLSWTFSITWNHGSYVSWSLAWWWPIHICIEIRVWEALTSEPCLTGQLFNTESWMGKMLKGFIQLKLTLHWCRIGEAVGCKSPLSSPFPFILSYFLFLWYFYFISFFHPSFFLGRAKSINGSWWRYRYVSTPFSAQKVPWMIHAIPFFSSKYAG